MAKTDPRIDAYLTKAPPFAVPILTHIRALVHRALPEAEETIKWSMPHFTVGGKNVCGMAAFKAHCAFTIHGDGRQGEAMGQYGRIEQLSDVPPDVELIAKVQEAAARVSVTGSAVPRGGPRVPKPEIAMPDDFAAALAGSPAAQQTYDGFPPSARRDYLEWITEAKAPVTRQKRIVQAVEWLGEGKRRHWKYQNC